MNDGISLELRRREKYLSVISTRNRDFASHCAKPPHFNWKHRGNGRWNDVILFTVPLRSYLNSTWSADFSLDILTDLSRKFTAHCARRDRKSSVSHLPVGVVNRTSEQRRGWNTDREEILEPGGWYSGNLTTTTLSWQQQLRSVIPSFIFHVPGLKRSLIATGTFHRAVTRVMFLWSCNCSRSHFRKIEIIACNNIVRWLETRTCCSRRTRRTFTRRIGSFRREVKKNGSASLSLSPCFSLSLCHTDR